MKKIFIISLVVILTFVVPYIVMQYNGNFTLKSYGSVLTYVGAVHIVIGLFNIYNGSDFNEKMTKYYVYDNNLHGYVDELDNKAQYNRFAAVLISIFLFVLGVVTIYIGNMIFQ